MSPKLYIILIMCFVISCKSKQNVDLILKDAHIYTVDTQFSVQEAMAIKSGKIIALGKNEDVLLKYEADSIISLKGSFIYPGFIDAHCHFLGYGLTLAQVDLRGTNSYEEVIQKALTHQKKYNNPWITGRGWDQNNWPDKEFPTKDLLDKAFPDHPVLLRRIDGHAAIANSKALKIAGINASTKIKGGKVLIANGQVTGLLIDKAVDKVLNAIPNPTNEQKVQSLLQAQENCFAVGLTSVGDAGLEKSDIELIQELNNLDKLKMRIYAMLSPTQENFNTFVKKGYFKSEYLNIRSVKLYADGALGSRGACMLEPYSDDKQNYGLLVESPDSLMALCQFAYDHNFQVNTHCIGDSANRLILDIYGSILKEKNDLRWRIEHAQVVNPLDLDKYGKYSIIPSVQTTHCTSDMYWAPDRLGTERIKHAYSWQNLLKQNGWLPNGSDFPIEDINPLYGFYAAISRQDHKGWPDNGFQPDQKLNREQALKAMTLWAAKAQFEENEKGSLEVGKMADFVVTSEDIMTIPVRDVFKVKVVQTFSNGQLVYKKKQ